MYQHIASKIVSEFVLEIELRWRYVKNYILNGSCTGKKKAYTALLQCRTCFPRKKWGPQRKDFGGGYGFPGFHREFVSTIDLESFFFEARKVSPRDFLSVVVVYAFIFSAAYVTLKTLTSLSQQSMPFFLGDHRIWSFPSVSSLSDSSIWRSWFSPLNTIGPHEITNQFHNILTCNLVIRYRFLYHPPRKHYLKKHKNRTICRLPFHDFDFSN